MLVCLGNTYVCVLEREALELTSLTGGTYVCSLGSLGHGVEAPRRWCVGAGHETNNLSKCILLSLSLPTPHTLISHSPMPRQVVRASHASCTTLKAAANIIGQ